MRLKDIREDLDLTQSEVADYLHIRQNTYSQYENGQRGLPIDILINWRGISAHRQTIFFRSRTKRRRIRKINHYKTNNG